MTILKQGNKTKSYFTLTQIHIHTYSLTKIKYVNINLK